ncbi:MAG: DEAD/DEAH box helicase family protein [Thermoplasmataceae archaeon]|jgi:superfamily II DNA or RNA helicase
MVTPELSYKSGLLILSGAKETNSSYFSSDSRTGSLVAPAYMYSRIVVSLKDFKDNVFPSQEPLNISHKEILRPYQREAIRRWTENQYNGIIVLPTAAGKTHIGIDAISRLSTSTLVIAPTIELIMQWRRILSKAFGIEIGQIGGGEKNIQPITVCTYDSAYLMAESLGNRFRFLLVDEVHHLASEQYIQIAKIFASPYRMGLTATLERVDKLHENLSEVMGGKVMEMGYEELSDYLANYSIVRIPVDLTPEEEVEYDESRSLFLNYLRKHRMAMRGPWDFERFILSSWNPEGREALLAWRRSREIAFSARAKIDYVRYVLSRHSGEKTLIFSEDTETAYMISREFLIPAITYLTPARERKRYLDLFRSGEILALAASRVLDEGVDVPDASVAIVLSGSGSARQFRQRLGRILRPASGKKSMLYEILAAGTSEYGTSRRRRHGVPVGTNSDKEVQG